MLFALTGPAASSPAAGRFPQPEFDSGHVLPVTATPAPRAIPWAYVDVAALFLALSLATHLALRQRSRAGLLTLSLASIGYFGFWRKGCICPVGSTQNAVMALFDPSYAIPASVLAFFLLPLVFTLFFGRTFCAAVCPLGAIQDVVVLRPLRMPVWLSAALGIVPVICLALALLFTAAGGMFFICRLDPFVGFYRLSGPSTMLILGGVLLLAGVFIARPYCRFFCPYGVLLNWASRLSKWHVTITPDDCVHCRLCEASCPFDAIRVPSAPMAPAARRMETRTLAILLLVLLVATLAGGWVGSRMAPLLADVHPAVRLARLAAAQDSGALTESTVELDALRQSARSSADLNEEAAAIQRRFLVGARIAGGFVGAAFVLQLIGLTLRRRVEHHIPDRGDCFSCGRCFRYCPREHVRLRKLEK